MTVSQIYRHYQIMPNLQLHMYQVAAVGLVICDHYKGQTLVDRDLITQTSLLHDMGNIIKFDLKGQPRWLKVKQDFIHRYGPDEYQATLKIAQELNMPKAIIHLLNHSNSPHLPHVAKSHDWHLKIASYADMRVAPHGVVSVNARFDDFISRYQHKHHPLSDLNLIETNRQACLKLEQQLQAHTSIDLSQITDATIKLYLTTLPDYHLTPEFTC